MVKFFIEIKSTNEGWPKYWIPSNNSDKNSSDGFSSNEAYRLSEAWQKHANNYNASLEYRVVEKEI